MQELAVLAASALATQRQFSAVADNIANANTDGYRRMDIQFKEIVSRPKGHATASYVEDRGLVMDFSPASLRRTGNPLDIAIGGEGFFAVQGASGEVHYTRRGNFVVDANGTLVTPSGEPLLDAANAPIQVPQGARTVNIARDGTVSTDEGQVGQVGVFVFSGEDLKMLQRVGSAAFVPTQGGARPVENPNVLQGFVEGSNVSAVEEMTTMQSVSRAYQRSLNLMNGIEQTEQRAIRTLGQTQ